MQTGEEISAAETSAERKGRSDYGGAYFENEFISLTDIAKYRNEDDPRFVIQNWMRNRNTIEFLGVWEELHNPDFNRVQFEAVKNEAGLNRFVMTPTKWITQMNAIGIVCIFINIETV